MRITADGPLLMTGIRLKAKMPFWGIRGTCSFLKNLSSFPSIACPQLSVKAGLNSFEAFEGFEKVVDGHSGIAGL